MVVSIWMMLGGIMLVSMIGFAVVVLEWRRQLKNNAENGYEPAEEKEPGNEAGNTQETRCTGMGGS